MSRHHPFNNDSTFWGMLLACASIDVPACTKIWFFVYSVDSVAISVSRM
jgi:hypothetical protein